MNKSMNITFNKGLENFNFFVGGGNDDNNLKILQNSAGKK